MKKEELYKVMDTQDETAIQMMTMNDIKDLIISSWDCCHFDTEAEMIEHDTEVENSNDLKYLESRLEGIGYIIV